jgi:putative transposase
MKQNRFTEEQIAFALKQLDEKLTAVPELSRKMGVSQQTVYNWRKKYTGMGTTEIRKMRALEEENKQLKRLVADLSLDKHMLQDVLSKKF